MAYQKLPDVNEFPDAPASGCQREPGCYKPLSNSRSCRWSIDTKHMIIELTPFCWGFGFDLGYVHRLGISFWFGPVYFEIGL